MRRIIVLLLLCVFVVSHSGCDKIKAELERRHLSDQTQKETQKDNQKETQKEAFKSKIPEQKTHRIKRTAVEPPSERRQIVFRIDLPTDEKIQIRLIKSPAPAEVKSDSFFPLDSSSMQSALETKIETGKQEIKNQKQAETKDEKQEYKSEKPDSSVEEESIGALETHLVEQRQMADSQQEKEASVELPQSGIETDREVRFPATAPISAPTVVVPANEMTAPPAAPDSAEKKELSRSETSETAPAENAVGLALSVTPPETLPPEQSETPNEAPEANKSPLVNPWSIPNADYPLRYY